MSEIKLENWFDRVLNFFVHNGFLITAIDMCMTHAALLLIYYLADIKPMVTFNIVSVIVYLFCILLCKYGRPMPVYFCILLEVSVYAMFGVRCVGWDSGTAYFLCAIVPVILYFGYMLLGKYRRPLIAALLLGDFALYVTLYVEYHTAMPIYQVPFLLNEFLVILGSFTMVFSTVFYNSVYIFSMRLKTDKLVSDNQHLKYEASRDGLTGWLNRGSFLPLVTSYVKDTNDSMCLVFIDIDNFKRVNDSYGHDCGDEVLRHVTKLIKNSLGESGIYCRWGGEELVVALKDYDLHSATHAMDIIRFVIAETSTIFYNKHIDVTVSVGVAEYFRDDKNPLPLRNQIEAVITLADERMYKGKQSGKNIVVNK